MWFSVRGRYARAHSIKGMRVLTEDEPYLAEAIRDGLRLEAIAADTAVLDRDIPAPSGDDTAKRIVASSAAYRS
uniref:Uncharacterized protein n=1 Tax=uncultured organism CA37 TaxID=941420 RepID=E9L1F2_9ZZZZ|nr:hypothetical protein CA37-8 [uncultured organism CA37]